MKTLLLLLLVLSPTVSFAEEPIPPVQLLDFTASYCKPCQQMLPILKRMENDGFPIREVDISEQPDLSKKYSVQAVPTLILLVNGRETFCRKGHPEIFPLLVSPPETQLAEQPVP
ncbi:MAG: thioredoxin family protein, partial [Planctomycetaceae bacterium]